MGGNSTAGLGCGLEEIVSHLRMIYHLRRVLSRSHTDNELEFHSGYSTPTYTDDFSRSCLGSNWITSYDSGDGKLAINQSDSQIMLGTAHWNDSSGPILFEMTTIDADGNEVLMDLKLL